MNQPAISWLPSSPREVLDLLWRRKWMILVPFVIIGGPAAFLTLHLPPLYRSSTTILVVKAKVPEDFVRSTVSTQIEDRLSTITQQILSRTRLERIIRQFDLYRRELAEAPLDVVVEQMRAAIDVQVLKGNNAFTISFRGRDPGVVRDVTNELAAFYIQENSKVREELATSAYEFIDRQLESLRKTLGEQEEQVRRYKERYSGELPQQLDTNIRTLDRLQLQFQTYADQVRRAEERRLLIQAQLTATPRTTQVLTRTTRPASAPGAGAQDSVRATLAQLQARYTDRHPDVVRARRQLEEMERAAASPEGAAGDAAAGGGGRMVVVEELREEPNPVHEQLEAQAVATEREIRHVGEAQGRLLAQIQGIQQRIEKVPKLEQQLLELTRDYNNTQSSYQQLLSKKLDAQIAEDLERRQKGEQFSVLDPATLPQTPFSPNRARMLVVGLFLGLGAGLGTTFGIEAMSDSVRRPRELRLLAPALPLLGTIPLVHDPARRLRRRLATATALVLFAGAYAGAGLAAFRFKDAIVSHPLVSWVSR